MKKYTLVQLHIFVPPLGFYPSPVGNVLLLLFCIPVKLNVSNGAFN